MFIVPSTFLFFECGYAILKFIQLAFKKLNLILKSYFFLLTCPGWTIRSRAKLSACPAERGEPVNRPLPSGKARGKKPVPPSSTAASTEKPAPEGRSRHTLAG
jgi:hypothetical protein